MKQIILVFIILISNWTFSQNDSISLANQIYAREFELSKPLDLPNYDSFKDLKINSIFSSLMFIEYVNRFKNNNEFANLKLKVFDRLKEMSLLLSEEGIFVHLTNGSDCSYNSEERNEKFNETKELYVCVGDCIITSGEREGMEVFNKATREIQNKLAYQRTKKEK
jgi:hypothetical protein